MRPGSVRRRCRLRARCTGSGVSREGHPPFFQHLGYERSVFSHIQKRIIIGVEHGCRPPPAEIVRENRPGWSRLAFPRHPAGRVSRGYRRAGTSPAGTSALPESIVYAIVSDRARPYHHIDRPDGRLCLSARGAQAVLAGLADRVAGHRRARVSGLRPYCPCFGRYRGALPRVARPLILAEHFHTAIAFLISSGVETLICPSPRPGGGTTSEL